MHLRYLPTRYRDPATEKASAITEPVLMEVLEAVSHEVTRRELADGEYGRLHSPRE